MNDQVYEQFKQLCENLPLLVDSEKENCEAAINSFLTNPDNFHYIRRTLEQVQSMNLKVVIIESLTRMIKNNKKINDKDTELAKAQKDEENARFAYQEQIIETLINYLNAAQRKDPNPIINTISNTIATFVESKAYIKGSAENISKKIIDTFFTQNNTLSDYYCGLKICYYVINNISIISNYYTFFTYRKMTTTVQTDFLYDIFNAIREVIKYIGSHLIPGEIPQNIIEVLNLSLEVYFKCLAFNFSMSYFDYKEDSNLEDISIILFPERFSDAFCDFDFFNLLFRILDMKITREISLETTRILSRMSASRTSILKTDEYKKQFKRKAVESFIHMAYNCPLNEEAFVSEILECVLRIIFVYGIGQITQHEDLANDFDKVQESISNSVIILSNQIDDKLMPKLNDFWRKIISRNPSEKTKQKIATYLGRYFEYNFCNKSNSLFFSGNIKSYKKFAELTENAFEHFKDLLKVNLDNSCQNMLKTLDYLLNEMKMVQTGNADGNVFMSKLGHFMLFFSFCFVKSDYYCSYIYNDEEPNIENLFTQTLYKICFSLTKIINDLDPTAMNLDSTVLNGYCFSVLFYFEIFFNTLLTDQKYEKDKNSLVISDGIFNKLFEQYQFSNTYEDFYFQAAEIMCKFLPFKSTSISKAVMSVLKNLIEKLKRIYRGKKKDLALFYNICKILIDNSNKYMIEPKQIKIRKNLFEVVGICYLDDKYSNYIENCHLVLKLILDNSADQNGQINLKKTFFDIHGIYKSISYTKVISIFTKIAYPKIKSLLEEHGQRNLSDNSFVCLLVDFYSHLFERTAQNYQVNQSQTIMFKIIIDACKMISVLLSELNSALSQITTEQQKLEFCTSNIKLIKKFLTSFQSLLKNTDVSFSVFHFFGSQEFLYFIKNIYKFLFLIYDCILTNFPDKEILFFDVVKESMKNLSNYIIEFFELDEIQELFTMLYGLFGIRVNKIMSEPNLKQNLDDNLLEVVCGSFKNLLQSLYEEEQIYRDNAEYQQKMTAIREKVFNLAKQVCSEIFEIAYLLLSSSKTNFSLAEVSFYFFSVFQNEKLFIIVLKEFLNKQTAIMSITNNNLMNAEQIICMNLDLSLNESCKDDFELNFSNFIKYLVEMAKNGEKAKNLHMQMSY